MTQSVPLLLWLLGFSLVCLLWDFFSTLSLLSTTSGMMLSCTLPVSLATEKSCALLTLPARVRLTQMRLTSSMMATHGATWPPADSQTSTLLFEQSLFQPLTLINLTHNQVYLSIYLYLNSLLFVLNHILAK